MSKIFAIKSLSLKYWCFRNGGIACPTTVSKNHQNPIWDEYLLAKIILTTLKQIKGELPNEEKKSRKNILRSGKH